MSIYYEGGYSANDSIDLMISILVRYPEINTVKTDPKSGEIIFSFLLKQELDQARSDELQMKLRENLETFLFIEQKQPKSLRFHVEGYEGYTFLEIRRDFETISQREISLLIQLVHYEMDAQLLIELNDGTESEELELQEELIDDLLDRLQFDKGQEDLIGYREAGRVMVFQKTTNVG